MDKEKKLMIILNELEWDKINKEQAYENIKKLYIERETVEINEVRFLVALKKYIWGIGSQVKAAKLLGISQSNLSDMLYFKRPIPRHVATKLGYLKLEAIKYQKI